MALDEPLPFYTVYGLGSFLLLGLALKLLRYEAALRPYGTWFVLLPPIFVAWWLGPYGWAVFVTLISALAFNEFARATGLIRERAFVVVVYAAMAATNAFAVTTQWAFFMVAPLWAVIAVTLVPILRNRTEQMLQMTALAVIGVVYFAWFLAHLTYLARAYDGLGLVIYVTLATQCNDAAAFLFGKKLGRHHWTRLSPNKTVEGSLAALAFSIGLAFLNWGVAFPTLPWYAVLGLGVVVSLGGQAGDLAMAMVKRNVGIKDWGTLLPGHGGILDRVNSLMLVSPVVFHLANYFFAAFPDQLTRF